MSTEPKNPPAFPHFVPKGSEDAPWAYNGMTLRDWFAGQALAAFITAPGDIGAQARTCDDRAAEWAYKTADAMLRAREAKP